MLKKIIGLFLLSISAVTATPKAILFDFGGVFTYEPKREIVVDFLQNTFQLTETEFNKVNEEKRKADQSDSTDAEFWLAYAKSRNISLPEDWEMRFDTVITEALSLNHDTFELVDELKAKGIPVALLSNIDHRIAALLRKFGLYELFSPCLLSCDIGFEKPHKKAFEIAMDSLGFSANEIVFIDDLEENILAAKELGIDAIQFRSTSQLREELNKRLELR